MASSLTDESLGLYADLMGEVKMRLWAIGHTVNGKTGLDPRRAGEFGFLQLRMICELTALACLLAHNDFEAANADKFVRESGADKILKGLERLNPQGFPMPLGAPARGPDGVNHFPFTTADCITKDELLTLYSRTCGNALHVGSLRKLRSTQPEDAPSITDVDAHARRIGNLLNVHRIYLEAHGAMVVCMLNGPTNGVEMLLGEKLNPN